MGGLSSASGAQPPGHSTSIVGATSSSGLNWQLTATTTPQPLATEWEASRSYTAGQVVKAGSRFYRCTTSGTSAATGNGPSGIGDDIEDGSAVWKGADAFANGLMIQNVAASGGQPVYWGWDSDVVSTVDTPIAAGNGFVTLSVADPTMIWVVTASSTARIAIAGLC